MSDPTIKFPGQPTPDTVEGCRAERNQVIDYIRFVSDTKDPDEALHVLESAARRIHDLIFAEYWIVADRLNPGDPQWNDGWPGVKEALASHA